MLSIRPRTRLAVSGFAVQIGSSAFMTRAVSIANGPGLLRHARSSIGSRPSRTSSRALPRAPPRGETIGKTAEAHLAFFARRRRHKAEETAKPGRYGDGRGLWLCVSPFGARKWIFRFTFGGRVTEMGLGNSAVSLAAALDRRRCYRDCDRGA